MVDFIRRDKNDIYSKKILGFLFKNQKFLFIFRVIVAGLFFYAIFLGFYEPSKENTFTTALFWSIFWPLFMVVTLPTFGRIFCGICPHGFLGKYITRIGLKKKMPKWMQNRYIGILLLVIGWWGVYYVFPGIYRTPLGTALLFTVMTLLAFGLYFLYRDMSYCKYICPIGTLTRAYAKLSFTWLGTYQSACSECRTFECATACPYNLKPFTFDKRNSMTDCTLCMECSHACEAISFKFKKPSFSLFSRFQIEKAEVWAYLLILASIPIAMAFHHGIGRSNAAGEMIWSKTAGIFQSLFGPGVDWVGLFAFLYAMLFTILAGTIGMYLASKILKRPFKEVFYSLGYSYAPLFILSSLGHALSSFFTGGYERIVEGFAWAFGFSVNVEPLARRGDDWLMIFSAFKWIGIAWALLLLYKRMKLIEAEKLRKILAFPFAASLIIFFLGVNMYRNHIIDTYGRASGGHGHMHRSGKMFQTVPPKKATILQTGPRRESCAVCGMKLAMFYKTNHAAESDGKVRQYCSLHCLAADKTINKRSLSELKVVDTPSLKFINADQAFYVVGSRKKGTMSRVSKYAFAKREDAERFRRQFGGKIVDFDTALKIAERDFEKNSFVAKPEDTLFFTTRNPAAKTRGGMGMRHGGMHRSGRQNAVPAASLWLAGKSLARPKCVRNVEGVFYLLNADGRRGKPRISKKNGCTKVSFAVPKSGYYPLYYVRSNQGLVNIAKYEYKRIDHSGEEVFTKAVVAPKTLKEIPIDLQRLKDHEDSFYSRLHSGEKVRFRVLKDGRPLEKARVTLQTQFGWQKTVRTDKNGIAEFQLINDYDPEWKKFNKRFREKYLVVATYDKGTQRYKISYSGFYLPARERYQSYAYALLIFLGLLVVIGVGVFAYRYRVQKPFREVSFDE